MATKNPGFGKLDLHNLTAITVAHVALHNAPAVFAKRPNLAPGPAHVRLIVQDALEEAGFEVLQVLKGVEGDDATLAIIVVDGIAWEIVHNRFYFDKPRRDLGVAWKEP